MKLQCWAISCALLAAGLQCTTANNTDVAATVKEIQRTGAAVKFIELRLNAASVQENDQYLCRQYTVPNGERNGSFAFAFEALEEAFGGHVHHMLVYGCDGRKVHDDNFDCSMGARPCLLEASRPVHVYGWAKDAAGYAYPEHIGFPLGDLGSMVIQVHYATPPSQLDRSGVRMYFTTTPEVAGISQYAGIVSAAATSNIVIPPHETKITIPTTCTWSSREPFDVFAFRVHAHALAFGYPITWELRRHTTAGTVSGGSWNYVAERDPALPQIFLSLKKPVQIRHGDSWRFNCSYNSLSRESMVRVGHSNQGEMCNLYLMSNSTLGALRYARASMACVDAAGRALGTRPRDRNQRGAVPVGGEKHGGKLPLTAVRMMNRFGNGLARPWSSENF